VFPGFYFVEVCVTLHWLDCSKSDCEEARSIPPCVECARCNRCDCLLTASPIGTVFAEFVFGSLHSGVSVDNGIGAEGAKVLGDSLIHNTTLTLLSLDLSGE
jgi:hypothetical protein